MAERLVLALFVTQENGHRAMANLALALQSLRSDQYHVFECDVKEYPEIVEEVRVLATPTLIRYWPTPKIEIVGDLSDANNVGRILLSATEHDPVLVHKLYAKQDVRHEELADRLRQAEFEKWENLDQSLTSFPFSVMDEMANWAKALAEREARMLHRAKFLAAREANSHHEDVDQPRRRANA